MIDLEIAKSVPASKDNLPYSVIPSPIVANHPPFGLEIAFGLAWIVGLFGLEDSHNWAYT